MSIWVVAFECYENEFMHYPVEVALLNITEGFCYTYHISYSPNLMDHHSDEAKKQFSEHGLGITTGDFAYDFVKQAMHEHCMEGIGPRSKLYVCNPIHNYLADHWF